MRALQRATSIAAFLFALLTAATAWAQNEGGSLELAIKATYLYKFAPFVEWPGQAFRSPSSPINLCIIGGQPFGDILDRAVAGQTVNGRTINVWRFPAITDNPGCHIAYVDSAANQSLGTVLALFRGAPVLTVTDGAHDDGASGVINFVIQDNRVRFEIDKAAAERNHLTISSKLLNLAVRVK